MNAEADVAKRDTSAMMNLAMVSTIVEWFKSAKEDNFVVIANYGTVKIILCNVAMGWER